jgi:hypothetical protein
MSDSRIPCPVCGTPFDPLDGGITVFEFQGRDSSLGDWRFMACSRKCVVERVCELALKEGRRDDQRV